MKLAAAFYCLGVLLPLRAEALVCLFGLGCGLAKHAASTYLAEVAPTRLKTMDAAYTLGTLLGYAVGYAAAVVAPPNNNNNDADFTRNIDAYVAFPVVACYAVGAFWYLPESPRWLVLRGRVADARAALARVYADSDDVRRTLDDEIFDDDEDPQRASLRLRKAALHSERTDWMLLALKPVSV
mmetsp:Transcript_37567/g.120510  ORF Transcript_37567/g.120510 Transcript_37567/m.120510 type:complete len:183 (-) Transcript_37567:1518-2066(-)